MNKGLNYAGQNKLIQVTRLDARIRSAICFILSGGINILSKFRSRVKERRVLVRDH